MLATCIERRPLTLRVTGKERLACKRGVDAGSRSTALERPRSLERHEAHAPIHPIALQRGRQVDRGDIIAGRNPHFIHRTIIAQEPAGLRRRCKQAQPLLRRKVLARKPERFRMLQARHIGA